MSEGSLCFTTIALKIYFCLNGVFKRWKQERWRLVESGDEDGLIFSILSFLPFPLIMCQTNPEKKA